MTGTTIFSNFIGGKWITSQSGATFGDENPARRGSSLGEFQSSTVEDVRDAVDAASQAFLSWRRTPVIERKQHVQAFLNLLRDSREELARIVTLENGKTIKESRAEVDSALVEGGHHVGQIEAFYEGSGPGAFSGTTWMQYEPVGVAGIISPWNFPMNVMCRKTLPALLTGNTVVFKPATFTPWSGVFMATLLEKAGLPRGVFNCVTGAGASIGHAIVTDPRVRAISFTGSTAVGRQIQQQAAANLTRTQLELGGKNALIVMEDADLAHAVDAAITAGFSNAGQWCTSTSRVLLQRPIARPFLEMLVARCEKMTVGDGLSEATDMGPVAGPAQYRDILAAIRRAEAEGAHMIAGDLESRAPSPEPRASGYFIRPTVFTQITPDMAIFQEETFGPVLATCEFGSIDEAITLGNRSMYGLSSAIFTTSDRTARAYIDGIEAGLAHVNIHTGYKEPAMPFGGIKQSGAGLPENSETGLEFFVDRKAVYVRG
jgi:alpha-ketoglutaric semialdehyde dehydrogenase